MAEWVSISHSEKLIRWERMAESLRHLMIAIEPSVPAHELVERGVSQPTGIQRRLDLAVSHCRVRLRLRYRAMDILEATRNRARIDIGLQQLAILNQALNEVCNGLDLWEFDTRMGVDRPTARALLAEIHSLILRMTESSDA